MLIVCQEGSSDIAYWPITGNNSGVIAILTPKAGPCPSSEPGRVTARRVHLVRPFVDRQDSDATNLGGRDGFRLVPSSRDVTGFKPFRGAAAKAVMKGDVVPGDVNFRHPKNVDLTIIDERSETIILGVLIVFGETMGIVEHKTYCRRGLVW